MEDNTANLVTQQAIKILEYWHKVEFFNSTDIKELEENNDNVLIIKLNDLINTPCLPWINPQKTHCRYPHFSVNKFYRYELFFGIFDRKEIFNRAKHLFPDDKDIHTERIRDQGKTCSIKCVVNNEGVIDSTSFQFSTVTWALGQIEEGKLDSLHFSHYQVDTLNLLNTFLEIIAAANQRQVEDNYPNKLTHDDIIEFLKVMSQWSRFSPEIPAPALLIHLQEIKPNNKEKSLPPKNNKQYAIHDKTKKYLLDNHSQEEDDNNLAINQPEITIFNSFYIQDIEKIIQHIKSHNIDIHSPLGQYLVGSQQKQPDLLLPQGKKLLLEKLKLSLLPAGRWPSDIQHNMSLMQQFAINTLEQQLALSGLYSVNGPPGTGKTTLLRDIIANNLVKRAAVLAKLSKSADAFDGVITENIPTLGRLVNIPQLIPSLCGFEMVVASNNNAAVENISRELPQINSLGNAWQDIQYLKPVAQKLAANTEKLTPKEMKEYNGNKLYRISALEEHHDCWGLIAAAFGNKANRDKFKERLFFKKIEYALADKTANSYQDMYSFRSTHKSTPAEAEMAFQHAQDNFNHAMANYQNILTDLQKIEAFHEQKQQSKEIKIKQEKLSHQHRKYVLFLKQSQAKTPSLWSLKLKKYFKQNAITQGLNQRLTSTFTQYQQHAYLYQQLVININNQTSHYDTLQKHYQDAIFADLEADFDTQKIQKTTFGHCEALNQARSTLTQSALALHQAWLLSADLTASYLALHTAIDGDLPNKKASLALWRLLFMTVPVVSSTFASVASQFNVFGAGEIGWLFIDEAGQATPQQAVGALWRAKRTVVVGDPLQTEPVFTIPPLFVEGLAKKEFGDDWQDWSPTLQSVQTLADRVNPFGTKQIAKDTWLGSPLRVHRRCAEPMFSIANEIAYNNKMLHGGEQTWPDECKVWGKSCWLDIGGDVAGKHYVPAQGEHVIKMLQKWHKTHPNVLPNVFIISPFREIKEQLIKLIKEELNYIKGIKGWADKSVGTIHTFQGKEEQSIIFVLGLSAQNRGSEQWASEKPNLLNVAITRAKKYIYIIGSQDIWASCAYFDVAYKYLNSFVEECEK